ncbi:MAG: hypothetical protein WKF60_08985, partial [Ilumatobacter sp.]
MTDPAGGRPDANDDTDAGEAVDDSAADSGSLKDAPDAADESSVHDGTGGRPRMTWSSVTEAGGAPRSTEPTEPADRSSSFRFDLGGALARLAGDDPETDPPSRSRPDGRDDDPHVRPPFDPVDHRAAGVARAAEPASDPKTDLRDAQEAGDEQPFRLNPLPISFARGSSAARSREPSVDRGGSAERDERRTIDDPHAKNPTPAEPSTEAPVADDQPNYPRRVPGTHLDRRHIVADAPQVRHGVPEITEATPVDEAPRPVARSSVFDDGQVDRYDPSVRGIGIVGSPSLPTTGIPILPVANPAAPPPVVEPVSNSTSMTG